jgi:hypothetical protein
VKVTMTMGKIIMPVVLAAPLAACGSAAPHHTSMPASPPATSAASSDPSTADLPQSTTTPNCPQINRVLNSVFDGSYAGLPPATTTQDLINNFLGETTDANGNPVNAMESVMQSVSGTPHGAGPPGMPSKLLQAEADLYVTVTAMADEQAGYWTQQNINALQSSLTTIDEICATPSTSWAQQFAQGLQ